MAKSALTRAPSKAVAETKALVPQFRKALNEVREEIRDNTYIKEAMLVLPVGGHRSAIGAFWNAVVDDLRNKIIHRSIELFNKSANPPRKIETYEDFQNHVNDDVLIEGAYKTGVIGWEASKIFKQAKETRHIFSGHPKSSEPSAIKVLSTFEDCIKYVLSEPYPAQIIDITAYLMQMGNANYDRSDIAIESALSDLPDIYKNELAHRLFSAYINDGSSSTLRSNIEFAAPILWSFLGKEVKQQVIRRVDKVITDANTDCITLAFEFSSHVDGHRFLSGQARRYKIAPLVRDLKKHQDNWDHENSITRQLAPYAGYVPEGILNDYVHALTMTYVGYVGASARFNRTDFYADGASIRIPKMFQTFDDKAAEAFIAGMRGNPELRNRIKTPAKMRRLRSLGKIVLEKVSGKFPEYNILEALADADSEKSFLKLLDQKSCRPCEICAATDSSAAQDALQSRP